MTARTKNPTMRGSGVPTESSGGFPDDVPTDPYRGVKADAPEEGPYKIVATSMKTPAIAAKPKVERELPYIKLRAMSEVSRAQASLDLGNLAPPYDPAEARKRSLREYVVWGSLAVVLACGIALVVWFAAT
jgi:hypothetical protein